MTPPADREDHCSLGPAGPRGRDAPPSATEPPLCPSSAHALLESQGQRPHSSSSASIPSALADVIRTQGLDAHFIAPGVPMPTVPLAAAAIGVPERQILKSLLFEDRPTGRLVLAIASGPDRIDRVRLAAAAGLTKLRMADSATVLAATGYPAGGVPPFGHATPLPVVLDRLAAALPSAYAGGGAEHLLLRLRPVDILRLTNATIADIIAAPTGAP